MLSIIDPKTIKCNLCESNLSDIFDDHISYYVCSCCGDEFGYDDIIGTRLLVSVPINGIASMFKGSFTLDDVITEDGIPIYTCCCFNKNYNYDNSYDFYIEHRIKHEDSYLVRYKTGKLTLNIDTVPEIIKFKRSILDVNHLYEKINKLKLLS